MCDLQDFAREQLLKDRELVTAANLCRQDGVEPRLTTPGVDRPAAALADDLW
jgi:hypothetical protein